VSEEQTNLRKKRGSKVGRSPLVILVCLALMTLLATIQTTHEHKVGANTSCCPLCIILHSTAPVAPTTAVIVVVAFSLVALVFKPRALVRYWSPKFITRPPPAGC
jgi:hypothetical protein